MYIELTERVDGVPLRRFIKKTALLFVEEARHKGETFARVTLQDYVLEPLESYDTIIQLLQNEGPA